MKKQTDWIVMGGRDGELAHCQRCGVGLTMQLPQSINVVTASMKAFGKDHKKCKPSHFEPAPRTPDEWLDGRDTGISSRTIFATFMGHGLSDYGPLVPCDPADFGRCYRLLKLMPMWRAQLSRVSERYPSWGPLVIAWDELTALYEEELPSGNAPKLYARMRELIAKGVQPATKENVSGHLP